MSWSASSHTRARLELDTTLPGLARLVAMLLAERANAAGITYNGPWLAAAAGGKHEASIRKAIHQCAATGLFEIVSRPPRAIAVRFPANAVSPTPEDAVPHLQAVPPVSEPCPQPAPYGSDRPLEVVHNPRRRARIPAPYGSDTRAVGRAIPTNLPTTQPAARKPSDMTELIALALAAASMTRRQAEAEGTSIRNVKAYEQTIADRLLTDDLDRLRRALATDATDHERAEWIIGRRRSIA